MTMYFGLVHPMPTSIKINDYDETKQTPCHHDAWPKHQNGCGKIILLITLSCPPTKFYGPRILEGLRYACNVMLVNSMQREKETNIYTTNTKTNNNLGQSWT